MAVSSALNSLNDPGRVDTEPWTPSGVSWAMMVKR